MTSQLETTKTTALAKLTADPGAIVKLSDLLVELSEPEVKPSLTPVLPGRIVPTAEQKSALAVLATMVEHAPTPVERRTLIDQEIRTLLDERAALDVAEGLIKEAKEAMRTTVFNHLDVEAEKYAAELPLDSKGAHYAVAGGASVDDRPNFFSREIRQEAAKITTAGLGKLDAAGAISHADYLAMTRPARVVSEEGVLGWIRRNPGRAHLLVGAMETGKLTPSLNIRKKG